MRPLCLSSQSLSYAWARAFLALHSKPGDSRGPSVVTISDLDAPSVQLEDHAIRNMLDDELTKRELNRCGTVSGTIFPTSLWNPDAPDSARLLFERYERVWPAIKKCPANRNGVYFRRLTSYTPNGGKPVNQLEYIIETYKGGNHRRSALQAAILDPTRDHTNNRVKGFPCLQQLAFTPLRNSRLSITGFYATQYQFEKSYGNYLGLYWLGRFMADQLDLRLAQVVCVASVLTLGDRSKEELKPLAASIRELLPADSPSDTEQHRCHE